MYRFPLLGKETSEYVAAKEGKTVGAMVGGGDFGMGWEMGEMLRQLKEISRPAQ